MLNKMHRWARFRSWPRHLAGAADPASRFDPAAAGSAEPSATSNIGSEPGRSDFALRRATRFALSLLIVAAGLIVWGCPGSSSGPPVVPRSALPDDSSIQWSQADTLSIQANTNPDAWIAGHVNDIVKFTDQGENSALVVASDTGGVWAITPSQQPSPLSDSWSSVSMNSLALGPGGTRHVYAGTTGAPGAPGGVLWETDTSAGAPLYSWLQVNPKPSCGSINKIVAGLQVSGTGDVIVLACDTGILWSVIPPAPSAHGTYKWLNATPGEGANDIVLNASFSGLAQGPPRGDGQPTIVASASAPTVESEASSSLGWYWGGWSGGNLVLNAASVADYSDNKLRFLGRTSLASCPEDLTSIFTVAADSDGSQIGGVWRSRDGGHSYALVTTPAGAGGQGWYNNSIAVAGDCHAVALGWQTGTFISYDAGSSWTLLQDNHGDLHSDIHGLTFDFADPTTLYIGSDGGVASASGLVQGATPAYSSIYNRQLFNLQINRGAASSQIRGLVTASLQDNGVVYAQLPGPWETLDGADGANTSFVSPSGLSPGADIIIEGGTSQGGWCTWGPWKWVRSNANGNPLFTIGAQQPIGIAGNSKNILDWAPVGVVTTPRYTNAAGQFMYAAAAWTPVVYGLFANNDGSGVHWEVLGLIASGQGLATAVSSRDGTDVLVGTDAGAIFQLTLPPNGGGAVPLTVDDPSTCAFGPSNAVNNLPTAVQLTVDQPQQGSAAIYSIAEFSSGLALAAYNVGRDFGNGYVLRWNGQVWHAVGGGLPNNVSFWSVVVPDLLHVFAASYTNVYSSHDFGDSWQIASDGLPLVTPSRDLHVVTQADGKRYLYLATYGWSLWRAELK